MLLREVSFTASPLLACNCDFSTVGDRRLTRPRPLILTAAWLDLPPFSRDRRDRHLSINDHQLETVDCMEFEQVRRPCFVTMKKHVRRLGMHMVTHHSHWPWFIMVQWQIMVSDHVMLPLKITVGDDVQSKYN